jgi:hypothetical protein
MKEPQWFLRGNAVRVNVDGLLKTRSLSIVATFQAVTPKAPSVR